MKSLLHGKLSVLALVVVLFGAMSATALAADKGDPLRLGVTNTMTLLTTLSGSVTSAMLQVVNDNTGAAIRASNTGGGPALDLRVDAGKAPFKVNSAAKVVNLNADRLDGLDASAFQRPLTGGCLEGESISYIEPNGSVMCTANNASGGDITGVTAGAGLTGGGETGTPTLSANFTPSGDGNGTATTVARGDHNHNTQYLALTGKAANADQLDNLDSSAFQQRVIGNCLPETKSMIIAISATGGVTCAAPEGSPYANVVVVAKSGGDFTSVQAALNSISPTATNRYLVYVAPGVYNEQVRLKAYVTLEGASEGATILRWTGGSANPAVAGPGSATLIGVPNAEVRLLTVESNGTGQEFAVAVYNNGGSPSLRQVTATASGAVNTFGVHNQSSSPVMRQVTVTASGQQGSGVYNVYSSPTIRDSTITGMLYSIYSYDGTVKVANSQLIGPRLGGLVCFGAYDADLKPITCS